MNVESFSDDVVAKLSTVRSQQEFYETGFRQGGSFGLRVSRGGRKVFFLIYALHGRRKRMTLGPYPTLSVSDARKMARKLVRQVLAGYDPAAESKLYRQSSTLRQLSQRFMESSKAKKPSTVREYRRLLDQELLPRFGDMKAQDINAELVRRLLLEISDWRGKPVLADRVRALLSAVINFAVKEGSLRKNPVLETAARGSSPGVERVLSPEEIKALWQLLEEEDIRISGIFKLLLLTGRKPSEVLSMRWADITFEQWRPNESTVLPLSPEALAVLRELHRLSFRYPFVFATGPNSHINYIRRTAKRLSSHFERSFTPFDLRRTTEVRLRELGVRGDVVEMIVGRQSAARRGAPPVSSEDLAAALQLWARRMFGQSAQPEPTGPRGQVIPLFPRLKP